MSRDGFSKRSGYTSGNIDYNDSGNDFVKNLGLHPLVNFNFMLRVEGIMDVPCKSVGSFTKENEFEYIKEGGLNDYVHMKRKPVSKPFTFTVERYVGVDTVDPLPLGAELLLPLLLFVSRYGNQFTEMARTYTFTGCTVIAKEYGRLDAEKSGLLTETVTIAYREMLIVDLPSFISYEKPDFEFSANPKNDRAIHSTVEVSKEKMASLTEDENGNLPNSNRAKFVFNSSTTKDSAQRGYQTINSVSEKTRSEMEAAASRYIFKADKKYRHDLAEGESSQPAGGAAGSSLYNHNEVRKADMEAIEAPEGEELKNPNRAQFRFTTETTKQSAQRGNQKFAGVAHNINEKSKTDMEAAAAEYNKYKVTNQFKGGNPVHIGKETGGVEGHAIVNRNEVRRGDMAKEATFNGKKLKHFEFKKENTYMKSTIGNAAYNQSEIRQKNMAKMAKINDRKAVKFKFSATNTSMNANVGNAFFNAKEIRLASMPNMAKFNKKKLKKFVFSALRKNMTDKYGNAAYHADEVRLADMKKNAVKYDIAEKKPLGNTTQVRSATSPHEDEKPEQRRWIPVEK